MTDRERLIELIHKCDIMSIPTGEFIDGFADYLLENGVIVPPVKVGGEVFCICRHINDGRWEVSNYKYIVTDGYITKNGLRFRATNRYGSIKMSDFGDTVFLTREEAENALKEREENA